LKGAFESGVAGAMLGELCRQPAAFLDDRGKAKLVDVSRELWRRLTETTEESSDAPNGRRCGWATMPGTVLRHQTICRATFYQTRISRFKTLGDARENVESQGGGRFFSRLGTEPHKRSLVYVLAPGAKVQCLWRESPCPFRLFM